MKSGIKTVLKTGVAFVLSFLVVFSPGCSVLKNRTINKSDSNFVQLEYLTSSVSLKERTESEIRLAHSDSSKHTFTVEISPEGAFTYSQLGGYKGKAKSLRISGSKEGWQKMLGAVAVHKALEVDNSKRSYLTPSGRNVTA